MPEASLLTSEAEKVFPGGGEMGATMRAQDWSQTPFGPLSTWPQSLRTAVGIMLASPQTSFIFWGPELSMLYNDAGRPILGAKHPGNLGKPMWEMFGEAREVLGPLVDGVLRDGTAVFLENLPIPLERYGILQDTFFTFSYLPIRAEGGEVGGMLAITMDTTKPVLAARRLSLIGELSIRTDHCETVERVLGAVEAVLAESSTDVPFALLYALRGERAELVVSAGLPRGTAASPVEIDLADAHVWPLAAGAQAEVIVDDLAARFGSLPSPLPGGPSGDPATRALLIPLAVEAAGARSFVLVVGLNPRIHLDDDTRSFLDLLARQIGASIASTRALEEQTQRAAQLAELDRQKTQFFSNVSHEFRTPLTLILGPTEDALASRERALAGADLERVHGNAQRLLKLVNALLEFSRVEAGRARAAFQPADLATQTAGIASAFESVISGAGLRYVVDCPPLPEPIWVDRSLWEKVVLNLLSNAFKFTLAGEITVRQRWTGAGLELRVSDTGIGIAPEDLSKVFQRFHRVEGAAGRSHEGSGIGLSLVDALVRLHGGTVSVVSTLGAGSTFIVTLPAGNAHLPAQDLHAAPLSGSSAAAFVREAARWVPGLEQTEEEPPHSIPDRISALPPEQVRILVADDNADMRGYVERVLAPYFAVEAVPDGQAALDAARERLPDLVLSDVMMPILDGLALTRALRADPRTRDVAIILLSARAGEGAAVEGLEAGADDYILKPFGARELVARIEGALRVGRAEQERRRALSQAAEILETTSDGFFSLDSAFRITAINRSCEIMARTRREDVVGMLVWDAFPSTANPASRFHQEYQRCMRERVPVQFVDFSKRLDIWTDVRAQPTPDGGIAVWFRDVTTAVRAREALVRQAEFEKQLIGIVSHDLRNPLNIIVMGAELLAEAEGLDAASAQTVRRVKTAADGATRLVRDLLDFTQARVGGGLHVEPRPSDWHALIRAAAESAGAPTPGRRVEVHAEGDGEGAWDPDRISQVVQNLVLNALKYSPAHTVVRVETRAGAGEVSLLVHNDGPPIQPEKLPLLFEPFQQGTGAVDRQSRSVGLGLYIVKQIVEAHRGSVEVSSTEARGTTFLVRLPRRAAVG